MKDQAFRNLVAALILGAVFGGLGLSYVLLASG